MPSFSAAHSIVTKIHEILGHKEIDNKFYTMEILQTILYYHSEIELN